MAVIRREDKEIIHHLSLLAALFGAIVGGFLVLHFHTQAHSRLESETTAVQTQRTLSRLADNLSAEEASLAQTALSQVKPEFNPTATDNQPQESIWIGLSQWSLWSICAGAAVFGSIAGYLSLWGAGWLGASLTYWLIRLLYRVIRSVAPNCAAAQRLIVPDTETNTRCAFQRNQDRLLPTLIKLFMLLFMALSVLAVVVWYLISL